MYALLLAATLVRAQTAEPAAMVLTTKGMVTLERGKEAAQRVGAMTLLWPGDRVQVPDGGEVTMLFLQDGHRERLKPKGTATVADKGCGPAEVVEPLPGPKLTTANLESLRSLAASSRGAVGVLRGDPPSKPQMVTPLYGTTILSERPTLTWPEAKADAYLVQLLNGAEGKDQKVLWHVEIKETRLPYPEKEKALELGKKYRWRVTPLKGDDASADPIVESKFLVLTKYEIGLLSNLKPLLESKSPSDVLLAAISYEAHGVYDEALRLYERLAKLSPDEANFQLALASYYERAGRKDLAAQARDRANSLGGKASENK
jgi:hypothetical protein